MRHNNSDGPILQFHLISTRLLSQPSVILLACELKQLESQDSYQRGFNKQRSRCSESVIMTALPCALACELQECAQNFQLGACFWGSLIYFSDSLYQLACYEPSDDPCDQLPYLLVGIMITTLDNIHACWMGAQFQFIGLRASHILSGGECQGLGCRVSPVGQEIMKAAEASIQKDKRNEGHDIEQQKNRHLLLFPRTCPSSFLLFLLNLCYP